MQNFLLLEELDTSEGLKDSSQHEIWAEKTLRGVCLNGVTAQWYKASPGKTAGNQPSDEGNSSVTEKLVNGPGADDYGTIEVSRTL